LHEHATAPTNDSSNGDDDSLCVAVDPRFVIVIVVIICSHPETATFDCTCYREQSIKQIESENTSRETKTTQSVVSSLIII
jgi:hypothetical protein